MKLVGANPSPQVDGLEELPGKSNYFIGSDSSKWRTNVATYARVKYREVYPGIDLVYYGNQRQLEYDWIVSPGAETEVIRFAIEGAKRIKLDPNGDLVLAVAGGDVRLHKPVVYQETDGVRHEIAGAYVPKRNREVGFRIADYDPARPLVIDPVLRYSTYLGGNDSDFAYGIVVDPSGNAYMTGTTTSANFPTANPLQPANAGDHDAFVTKFNSLGSALVYSTYHGGIDWDFAYGIAVDPSGSAYVTGEAYSSNFPTTAGAFQASGAGANDAFVVKIGDDTAAPARELAYITNVHSNSVSVINTTSNTVTATISVGPQPSGVGTNQGGTRAHVTNTGGHSISVIDTVSNSVVATVAVGHLPVGAAVNNILAQLYVTNTGSDSVSVIDTSTNTVVATVPVGQQPLGVAVILGGTRAYVANSGSNNVSVIDTLTNMVLSTVPVGHWPSGLAVSPDGTRAYVANTFGNSVSVINTLTNMVLSTVHVGPLPSGLAVSPDGTRLYITTTANHRVAVMNTVSNTVINKIPVGSFPIGVDVNLAGTAVYVANTGRNTVSVIDTGTNTVKATVTVGSRPVAFGLFITPH